MIESRKQTPLSILIIPSSKGCQSSSFSINEGDSSTTSAEAVSSRGSKEAQHASTSSGEADQRPKRVEFSRAVRVRKISKHDRYSDEERSSMWYSSEEFKAIRESAIKTVKKMMKNKPVDSDPNDCSRGLEGKTPKRNKIRQGRKLDIIWSVLSEQSENDGCDDESRCEAISRAYIECNRSCIFEAERRGVLDAIEVWGTAFPSGLEHL